MYHYQLHTATLFDTPADYEHPCLQGLYTLVCHYAPDTEGGYRLEHIHDNCHHVPAVLTMEQVLESNGVYDLMWSVCHLPPSQELTDAAVAIIKDSGGKVDEEYLEYLMHSTSCGHSRFYLRRMLNKSLGYSNESHEHCQGYPKPESIIAAFRKHMC